MNKIITILLASAFAVSALAEITTLEKKEVTNIEQPKGTGSKVIEETSTTLDTTTGEVLDETKKITTEAMENSNKHLTPGHAEQVSRERMKDENGNVVESTTKVTEEIKKNKK